MKHFFALPAILRPALYLAAASQHAFSVQDDLLAFPQFDVRFSDEYVTASFADAHTSGAHADGETASDASQVERPGGTDANDDSDEEEQKFQYETLRLDGFKYLCRIPVIPSGLEDEQQQQQQQGNETVSKAEEEEERELARASDRGWELLDGMKGKCVYYVSGWWSYRFCYGQGIRQFHQLPPSRGVPAYPPVEDTVVEGYELGFVGGRKKEDEEDDDESQMTGDEQQRPDLRSALDAGEGVKRRAGSAQGSGELVQSGQSRYLVQKLGGGTRCDLTGKDRRTEVQSLERISLIKETATCAYLMVIQTPRLCNDVAFLPPQKDAPNSITCQPILATHEIESYERDMQALDAAASHERELWAEAAAATLAGEPLDDAAPLRVVVGDVVIGGGARIPAGVQLEKSVIVGGGKETLIGTVASSVGKSLTDEDLKKLGLGDPKAIKELRKQLETFAEGQNWKLNVVDTPNGREYQGVIGDDDEEEEGAQSQTQTSGDRKVGESDGKGEKQTKKQEQEWTPKRYICAPSLAIMDVEQEMFLRALESRRSNQDPRLDRQWHFCERGDSAVESSFRKPRTEL
nr:protein os-9 like [Quercus suber]